MIFHISKNKPSIKIYIFSSILSLFSFTKSFAQPEFKEFENLFTTPRHYVIHYIKTTPVMDGNLDEESWKSADWSDAFTDIEGDKEPAPRFQTRIKLMWNDSCLFVAAELKEDHIWAALKDHDDVIYTDNDFEVFLDPDNDTHLYYEIEVNAINAIFDLFLPKPYRNNGKPLAHWDLAKMQSAIKVLGTVNNPSDKDTQWTVEMAIPFQSIRFFGDKAIPVEGTVWRANFLRVQWDTDIRSNSYFKQKDPSGRNLPEHNWTWSPPGIISMHYPERWGYLQFTKEKRGEKATFELPYAEKQKKYLWLIYYKQKVYYQKHNRYADDLEKLGFKQPSATIDKQSNLLHLEATSEQFMATIQVSGQRKWSIDQDGLVQYLEGK